MYIVLMVKNYDTEPVAVMFTTRELATNYMKKWWDKEYTEAQEKSKEKLYPAECYCENKYAVIEWDDQARMEFYVVKDSRPQEWR